MKIAVVAPSPVPFTQGGAERVVLGLYREINDNTPHDAELIKLPSREHSFADLVESYTAFAQLDLSHFDMVVSSKYPAWMVEHPDHRVYMLHPLRGLYDTYELFGLPERQDRDEPELRSLYTALRSSTSGSVSHVLGVAMEAVDRLGADHPAFAFPGPLIRELLHWLDAVALGPDRCTRAFAISGVVARRPGYFPPGTAVTVVTPPSFLSGFHSDGSQYLFTASRLDRPKRLDLLIAAMAHVHPAVPLIIAGTGPDRERLESLAADQPQIEFVGFVNDEELLRLYASALAVPFVPLDEDLGLITLEAHMSGKPVVTCTDSGGPAELVVDGASGFVVPPVPAAIGSALSRLSEDRALARRMGEAGRTAATAVTWEKVVEAVLAPSGRHRPVGRRRSDRGTEPRPSLLDGTRPRVLALSTYPASPARGGGQLRCLHLLSVLADTYDVMYIGLDQDGFPRHELLQPGFEQVVVPRNHHQLLDEARWGADAGIPVTDIVASLTATDNHDLVATVRAAARSSSLVLLQQPYLLPLALEAATGVPLLYDSQNAEFAMKPLLLPDAPTGHRLAEIVEEVERAAVRRSSAVVACSAEDADSLSQLGPTLADFVVIPNGTDTKARTFVPGAQRRAQRDQLLARYREVGLAAGTKRVAIFVASYHPPNNEAADRIVHFAGELPDVLFSFVGSQCNHLQGRDLPENVVLAGVVSDVELGVLLASADVALNPMTTGSGTNLKLLESFAAGLPVVATPFGTRGVDLVAGEHAAVVAIEDFVAGIRTSIDRAAASDQQAVRARRLVEQSYDWRMLGHRLTEVVQGVIGRVLVGEDARLMPSSRQHGHH